MIVIALIYFRSFDNRTHTSLSIAYNEASVLEVVQHISKQSIINAMLFRSKSQQGIWPVN